MLNIFNWLLKVDNVEKNLIKEFKKNPQVYIEPMISYFNTSKRFTKFFDSYASPSGEITVRKDIYGFEVRIKGFNHLLDCCPEEYGLRKEQGGRLYDAILSCVPGSVSFKERVEKSISDPNSVSP